MERPQLAARNADQHAAYREVSAERPWRGCAVHGTKSVAANQAEDVEHVRRGALLGVPLSLLTSLHAEQIRDSCEACARETLRPERGNAVAVLRKLGDDGCSALVAFPTAEGMDRIALAEIGPRASATRVAAVTPCSEKRSSVSSPSCRIMQLVAACDPAQRLHGDRESRQLLWRRTLAGVALLDVSMSENKVRVVDRVSLSTEALHVCCNPHYGGGARNAIFFTRGDPSSSRAAPRYRGAVVEWCEGCRKVEHVIRSSGSRSLAATAATRGSGTLWDAPWESDRARLVARRHCGAFGAHPRVLWCAAASTEVEQIDLRAGTATPLFIAPGAVRALLPLRSHMPWGVAVATEHSAVLFDARYPRRAVVHWRHGMRSPPDDLGLVGSSDGGDTVTIAACSFVSAESVALSYSRSAAPRAVTDARAGMTGELPACTRHVASSLFPVRIPSLKHGESLAALSRHHAQNLDAKNANAKNASNPPERQAGLPNSAARRSDGAAPGGVGAGLTSLDFTLSGLGVLGYPASSSGLSQARMTTLTPWGDTWLHVVPHAIEPPLGRPSDAVLQSIVTRCFDEVSSSETKPKKVIRRRVCKLLDVELSAHIGLKAQINALIQIKLDEDAAKTFPVKKEEERSGAASDGEASSDVASSREEEGQRTVWAKQIGLSALFTAAEPNETQQQQRQRQMQRHQVASSSSSSSSSSGAATSVAPISILDAVKKCFKVDPQPHTLSELRRMVCDRHGLEDVDENAVGRALNFRRNDDGSWAARGSTSRGFSFYPLPKSLALGGSNDIVCFRDVVETDDFASNSDDSYGAAATGPGLGHTREKKRRRKEEGAVASASASASSSSAAAHNPILRKLQGGWKADNDDDVLLFKIGL